MVPKMSIKIFTFKAFILNGFSLYFLMISLISNSTYETSTTSVLLRPRSSGKTSKLPIQQGYSEPPRGYYKPPRYPHQPKRPDPHVLPNRDSILANAPWSIKLLLLKDEDPYKTVPFSPYFRPRAPWSPAPTVNRRVGMEALVLRRQESQPPEEEEEVPLKPPDAKDDDSNMRLKLFRLMYETVRDSDLKVKRAELIRKHYSNSTSFEIGFLMGEVQEKFDVIVEFSTTLKKFYDRWKPIEHINAYEQIANYGIQINHLIDLIKTISKNGSMTH